MAYARTESSVAVVPVRMEKIHYVEEKALFGLLHWWREVRRETLDEWLNIQIETVPAKVFVNGVEYAPKNPTQ